MSSGHRSVNGTDDSSLTRMEVPLRVVSRMSSTLPLEPSSSSCSSLR